MEDFIQEIADFLQQYKNVYGPSVYLEGEWAEQQEIKTTPALQPKQAPKPIQRRPVLKQRSPELQACYDEIKDCTACDLSKSRKNFVFGYGHPQAKIMLIGEAPGREEDETGIPFVGAAGKLLDKMLQAIGIVRDDVFIANVLKCRPPQNRDPLPDEVVRCEPYLKKQLEIIRPAILISLGRISGQTLLRSRASLSELRREVHEYNGIPLLVTYHPSALLRNPRWKQESWQDLKKLKGMFDAL